MLVNPPLGPDRGQYDNLLQYGEWGGDGLIVMLTPQGLISLMLSDGLGGGVWQGVLSHVQTIGSIGEFYRSKYFSPKEY
jgi:hypothetical protein